MINLYNLSYPPAGGRQLQPLPDFRTLLTSGLICNINDTILFLNKL
jgi:hypothetical protein